MKLHPQGFIDDACKAPRRDARHPEPVSHGAARTGRNRRCPACPGTAALGPRRTFPSGTLQALEASGCGAAAAKNTR